MTESRTTGYQGTVAVLGLGYVGLPLVGLCIEAGYRVVGFDVDQSKVSSLLSSRSYVDDVADPHIKEWLNRGFTPSHDPEDLHLADIFIICVPTPLAPAGGPDLTAVEAAAREIEEAINLRSASRASNPLVILESTTYPGTTEEVVRPIFEKGGRDAGREFFLAFSPERIDPGNTEWTIANTPKLVGGVTAACGDSAETFYRSLGLTVVRTKGTKEAEMAKLLENTYRHVNIALVNELWRLSHELGIDVWDVIAAAETKPYGFQAFRPGPGVGGHCIPIDPNYLSHRVRSELGQTFRMIELAQEINSTMPDYVVSRTQEMLNESGKSLRGSSVVVLGVTYKPGISDMRESPAIPVLMGLMRRGAQVDFFDPYVEEIVLGDVTLRRVCDPDVSVEHADCVVLIQAHHELQALVDSIESSRILDTRGMKRETV